MKKLVPVLLIVGGYLAYHFYETKKAIDELVIKLTGVSIDKSGTDLLQTILHLTLTVVNPSPVNLVFRQFYGSILYQNKIVANFNVPVNQNVELGANQLTLVPLDAAIENISLLTVLPGLIATGLKDLTLSGTIVINSISLPVNFYVDGQ